MKKSCFLVKYFRSFPFGFRQWFAFAVPEHFLTMHSGTDRFTATLEMDVYLIGSTTF